ncbi:MAG: polysulfide reductase NrfD, partial [Actinobacteria bacterium]|nr:polysulfide reductase NrfD [Actinomycetota bacterium]
MSGGNGAGPGREGRRRKDGRDRNFPQQDHPGDSYYGRPIINPPVWEEREIAGYLFTGGLAGASSLLAAGADLSGRPTLARGSRVMAGGAIGISLLALVKDLGRPERFLNMLRVFKPTSPMSVGVWILVGYAPLAAGVAASDVSGRLPKVGRAAGLGAATLGAAVSTYTAALIANTAVPAWHEGRRELPYLFAGSAASAAAGWGLIVAPKAENDPAVRMAVVGALVELGAEKVMERRLGMV